MAIALVVLAIGSVAAGYIGVPHALGGHNALGTWLEPAFETHGPEVATGSSGMTLGTCVAGAPDTTTAGGALSGMAMANCEPGAGTDVALASRFLIAEASQPPAEGGAQAATHTAVPDEAEKLQLEQILMVVSSLIALLGIGLATWLWLRRPEQADRIAARFPGLHRVLLNKYYVDEFYDLTVVQPVRIVSEDGLWRGMDARVVDGAVNGAGQIVGGMSAVLRLMQSGSVKTYAAATLLGVVAVLAYYMWR
jgi:NADH-quinone oxidoreductase subunit L